MCVYICAILFCTRCDAMVTVPGFGRWSSTNSGMPQRSRQPVGFFTALQIQRANWCSHYVLRKSTENMRILCRSLVQNVAVKSAKAHAQANFQHLLFVRLVVAHLSKYGNTFRSNACMSCTSARDNNELCLCTPKYLLNGQSTLRQETKRLLLWVQ